MNCERLRSVTLGKNSLLKEIGVKAFYGCALESFSAPPQLEKIGDMAFGGCNALSYFRLNDNIRELGWLCFWGTKIDNLEIPA